MLEKIMTNSRNTEVHGVGRLIHTAYQRSGLTADLVLAKLFTNLVELNNTLGEAIESSKVESILSEKNATRNYAVRAVGYLIKGYTYYPEEPVRKAAIVVKKVFDKYGFSITKQSYVTESSHIVSMLGDFNEPDMLVALALLPGVSANIAALQLAQGDFVTTRAKYAKELAKQETKETASALQKEVVKIINNDLVVFLRMRERFQPTVYANFAGTVAKMIATNNEQIKRRQKKEDAVLD